jgi:hypothetical protein
MSLRTQFFIIRMFLKNSDGFKMLWNKSNNKKLYWKRPNKKWIQTNELIIRRSSTWRNIKILLSLTISILNIASTWRMKKRWIRHMEHLWSQWFNQKKIVRKTQDSIPSRIRAPIQDPTVLPHLMRFLCQLGLQWHSKIWLTLLVVISPSLQCIWVVNMVKFNSSKDLKL